MIPNLDIGNVHFVTKFACEFLENNSGNFTRFTCKRKNN
ncbi:hypothetical protein MNBD_GAMMA01-967 [hydrothermal vent metagenome]|uniref:Uncharacterized protein n=1 Tax=hydrothermal vent metagenome TaxID=652676 RepID=A0A3B0VRN3_9ZZZZ